jgi:hypothetical protein
VNAQTDTIMKNYVVKDPNEMKTLFGSGVTHGFYLGFTMSFSEINKSDAIELGGRLGWIVDHKFAMGLDGQGFANNIMLDNVIEGQSFELAGGYGGLFLEPIFMPRQPVHLSFPVTLGVGGVAYTESGTWYEEDPFYDDADAFFIVKPGVEIELNLMTFIRFALAANYRYAYDVNLRDIHSDILNGFSGGFSLKFGKF